jgi:hypothetical protein
MGDRGNIAVQESADHRVYLYGHWSGYDMPEILRAALIRGNGRWNDPQYLARIIFAEMIKNDPGGTTGYGISARVHDNEYPIIVVDCEKQEIRFGGGIRWNTQAGQAEGMADSRLCCAPGCSLVHSR